jgi:dihydroorotase
MLAVQALLSRFGAPRLLAAHPQLRIVCEHITTRTAAEFVTGAPGHNCAAEVLADRSVFKRIFA